MLQKGTYALLMNQYLVPLFPKSPNREVLPLKASSPSYNYKVITLLSRVSEQVNKAPEQMGILMSQARIHVVSMYHS